MNSGQEFILVMPRRMYDKREDIKICSTYNYILQNLLILLILEFIGIVDFWMTNRNFENLLVKLQHYSKHVSYT